MFDLFLLVASLIELILFPVMFSVTDLGFSTRINGTISSMRVLRVFRLSRIFKRFPQLMILVKGLLLSVQPVTWAFALLILLLFIFSLFFTTQCKVVGRIGPDGEQGCREFFPSVETTMETLLFKGTFLDECHGQFDDIYESVGAMHAFVFLFYIILSAFTVLNLVVGVLCEVITMVKDEETAKGDKSNLEYKLRYFMQAFDKDGDAGMNRQEYSVFLSHPDVVEAMEVYGTNVGMLQASEKVLFREGAGQVKFEHILETLLECQGTQPSTMRDVVELREFVREQFDSISASLTRGDK